MHGSSQTKLKRLTLEQTACMEGHRKRWAQIRTSVGPANREEAERGIAAAYSAAGWPEPRQVVWCSSPMQMATLWAKTPHERSGANLRSAIADQVRSRAAFAIQRRVSGSLLATVEELSSQAGEDTLGDAVREAVLRASQAVRPAAPQKRPWLFWLSRPRSWQQLQDAGYAPRSYSWLERHDFFRTVCGLTSETEPLAGLLLIAEHADWIIPYKHICWVSEPPGVFKTDERGRLHSASGPALQYRDGWGVYAWKGVEVPARVIERPEQITVADIDRTVDIHVRRSMIERMTPERFIASGAAYQISEDETGILWEKRWADGDAWAAIEVVNGTPEPDGTHKRYFLQVPPNMLTARSAVAWTYGLTARQYRGLLQRT
jgi:hypothetical protein